MIDQSTIEAKEGYLIVTARGDRNDFQSVIEGTKMVNEAARIHKVKYVLADYRFMKFNVPLADAFNLVKMYEQKLPVFSEIVISAVTNKDNMEIAKFWESICVRRGFQYKVFTQFENAENWLRDLIRQDTLSS